MLQWLAATPLSRWVTESDYGFYVMLSGHAIGMAVVVGIIFLASIRLLGFSKDEPLAAFERLFNIAWAGFLLNLATGLALLGANGERLVRNPAFLLKIGFIALGGLAIWALWGSVKAAPGAADADGDYVVRADRRTQVLAVATMAVWTLAIVAGRWIAYTPEF